MAEPKLVKMTRGSDEADVHPDEVGNYQKGGWEVKGEAKTLSTFQGLPNFVIDAGNLGKLVFDDGGVFVANDKQAKWLRKAIADKAEFVNGVIEVDA